MASEPPAKVQRLTPRLPTIELAQGVVIPALGYGTGTAFFAGARGEDKTIMSVKMALHNGLLHIDEAEMYKNDAMTGKALREWFEETGTQRCELFVTGKVLGSVDGLEGWAESIEASCRGSLERLGIDYFDLYLIHAPCQLLPNKELSPFKRSLPEVWAEMEALVSLGLARSIGVSNWRVSDLESVFDAATIKPCLNQVENHPHLQQAHLMDYCGARGIAVASYGGLKPLTDKELGTKRLMTEVVPRIAAAHGKNVTQILQRWNFQSAPFGRKVVITTTEQSARLEESMAVFDGSWELSAGDMAEIDAAGNEHHFRAFWRNLHTDAATTEGEVSLTTRAVKT
mmetsp:Transcript_104597/g.207706  ORF Transcript_104597/g.207706 Transcript_104597/m.207706 type:complete len:342 (+) Transcript_104597:249-1274(+)|eukprot:CAMPEP_0172688236 /NCGR_PEP_ID=MMETSP1074-20121228/22278_1 /TAXON_ID=2916 /ORGANISM="Ceratium fusus, Strain PA161109" /LENGTH=341 /DNA_ID=CAMNT_0013507847 /DNA_START=157 /DNA_END=1182 /DNA_ORIENTATION=+